MSGRDMVAALKRPTILVGGAIVGGWLFCALFAEFVAPYNPLLSQTPLLPPLSVDAAGHFYWLGTDLLGRDILSRLIYGARTVVVWSTLATAAAFVAGIGTGL